MISALERMLAMRAYMRAKTIDGVIDEVVAEKVGMTGDMIEEMYHVMAIANYEDRFVIPTTHREISEDAYDVRGSCGFTFGNGCSGGTTDADLFGAKRARTTQTAHRYFQGKGLMNTALKNHFAASVLSDQRAAGVGPGTEKAPIDAGDNIGQREALLIKRLADDIASLDLYEAQERYVYLFDRTRTLSLHLFEHVHGESREPERQCHGRPDGNVRERRL